jgi:hypothetical protein
LKMKGNVLKFKLCRVGEKLKRDNLFNAPGVQERTGTGFLLLVRVEIFSVKSRFSFSSSSSWTSSATPPRMGLAPPTTDLDLVNFSFPAGVLSFSEFADVPLRCPPAIVERVGVGTGDVTRPPALQLALALAVEEARPEAEDDLARPARPPIVGVGVCVPLRLLIDGRDFAGGGPIEPFVDEFKFEVEVEDERGVPLIRLLFPSATFDTDTVSFEFFFTTLPLTLPASSEDIAEGGRDTPKGVAVNTLESLR